ncbi:MAG: hypothetical protein NVS4B12_17810 [Ktedonobacteraceae bacterium]
MAITMSVGFLILRLVVGLTLAVHGTQKLFVWFAGPGLAKLKVGFELLTRSRIVKETSHLRGRRCVRYL